MTPQTLDRLPPLETAASNGGQPDRRDPERARLRVLVVAPVRFFADALAAELSRYPHLAVQVWLGSDTPDPPDVVLVEMRPPHLVQALHHFRNRFPGTPVVAMGVEERPDLVVACVEAGAAGYVATCADVPQLVAAIDRASRGEAFCPPAIMGELFRRVAGLAREAAMDSLAAALLTSREKEIAAMLGRGLSNKAIARQLGIRIPTVKCHVHQVLRKLGATSRLTLVAAGRRHSETLERPAAAIGPDLDPVLHPTPPEDR